MGPDSRRRLAGWPDGAPKTPSGEGPPGPKGTRPREGQRARDRRDDATRSRDGGCLRRAWSELNAPVGRAGAAGGFAGARPASDVRERTLVPLGDGVRAIGGCARGLCRLQKSTSGAWSDRKVMGLASWLHTLRRVAAPGAKARRKPGRGGEGHEHASSDTGGGLLEIPRVPRASAARDRGREHSAMEGVLIRRSLPSLTRRRGKAGLAIQSDGDAASRPDPRRIVTEDVRGDVASPARGRKHREREVAARRGRRSWPRQDRAVPLTRAFGAQPP